MKRSRLLMLGALALAAVLLTACAPAVSVTNNTDFAVRAVVFMPGAGRQVLSVSPGYSSTAEGAETGRYTVAVISDAEWIEWARLKRKVLNDMLANSESLTGPQLLDVIRELKDIAARIQQFESAAGNGAACGGAISDENSFGAAEVSLGAGGQLVVVCR